MRRFQRYTAIEVYNSAGDGFRFENSFVTGSVTYGDDGKPGTCKLTIPGVSRQTLETLKATPTIYVRVIAGSKDDYGQLFEGTAVSSGITHVIEEGTSKLEVECTSGSYIDSARYEFISKNATTAYEIVEDIAKKLGLVLALFEGDKTKTFSRGVNLTDNVYAILDNLAQELECKAVICDNNLSIIKYTSDRVKEEAQQGYWFVSTDNNTLISWSTDTDDTKGTIYKIKCFLLHDIRPGSVIIVEKRDPVMRKVTRLNLIVIAAEDRKSVV